MTIIEPDLQNPVDTTDGEERDRMTHVVYPAEKVTEAIINGTPVTALCGKTWIPSRDPERYPVCKTCIEVFEDVTGRPWRGRR